MSAGKVIVRIGCFMPWIGPIIEAIHMKLYEEAFLADGDYPLFYFGSMIWHTLWWCPGLWLILGGL